MQDTIKYIQDTIKDFKPEIGIILGSGLGSFVEDFKSIKISYTNIPGFEKSNVEGHKGQLVFAEVMGKKAVIMQGRYHYYEGYPLKVVTYPVKVMKKLGVETLIITNAAGIIDKSFQIGDLMFITDHINFMGNNPLIGENDDSLGVRFPDMSEIYSKVLIEKAQEVAKKLGIRTQKGVYAATTGPSYETPAEIKMLGLMGASAVGMSTVPEAIVAYWCGMRILGISCLTNYATGVSKTALSHQEVIDTTNRVKSDFKKLLIEIIRNL